MKFHAAVTNVMMAVY